MNNIVEQFNATTQNTVEEVSRQQNVLAEQQGRAGQALNETQQLDERLKNLGKAMDDYTGERDILIGQLQADSAKIRTDVEYEFNTLKANVESWFELAKAHIDGQGTGGGISKGGPHGGHKSVDKKEIAVWKIPEDVDKAAFRHWVDAVDFQLEMVHDFRHAGFVLNQVRRSKVAIYPPVFETLLETASLEIRKSQVEMGIAPTAALSVEMDYPFQQRTTFSNAYFINKLSTSLHDRTVGVEHHNGFEIYRQVCQMIGAVPENAEFHMANDLTILSRNYGAKVTDLKSLYMASDYY